MQTEQHVPIRMISADHFKSWHRCQKQYDYKYVSKLGWPSDQRNFELGKDVHKLMDYQSRGLDCLLVLTSATESVQQCYQKLMGHPLAALPVVASEWAFLLPVDAYRVTGRIDRISQDPATGDVYIIDWKTGTGAPKLPLEDWQTMVYLVAVLECRATLGLASLVPQQLHFVYLEARPDTKTPVREIRVDYGPELHARFSDCIRESIARIDQADQFELPPECPDRFCPYRPICGIDEVQAEIIV